jgi:hypothetical protein
VKLKQLNILLIITSLLGYLEWGNNQHSFLFEAEMEVLSKLFSEPLSVLHPLTILPMLGQLLLLITLFLKKPSKLLNYTGIICLSLLLVMVLLTGLVSLNYKIICSTLPFFVTVFYTVKLLRKTS